MSAMKITWLFLGLMFLTSFFLPASMVEGHTTYGFQMLHMAIGMAANPGMWILAVTALANVWFVWAWILGWSYLNHSKQQYLWKVVIGVGVFFNLYSLLPLFILMKDPNTQFGVFVWYASLLVMLMQVIVISRDKKLRNVQS